MPYTLKMDEYYDAIVYDKKEGIPQLVLNIYEWVSDFTDRRGFRQNWDAYLDENEQNEFLNKIYTLLEGKDFTKKELKIIRTEIKKLPGIEETYSEIDDDIIKEIDTTWLNIFTNKKQ